MSNTLKKNCGAWDISIFPGEISGRLDVLLVSLFVKQRGNISQHPRIIQLCGILVQDLVEDAGSVITGHAHKEN